MRFLLAILLVLLIFIFPPRVYGAMPPDKAFGPQIAGLGAAVLDISLNDGHLTLNICGGIRSYGGTFFEWVLVEKLLAHGRMTPNAAYFTLRIDGRLTYLPEGSLLEKILLQ